MANQRMAGEELQQRLSEVRADLQQKNSEVRNRFQSFNNRAVSVMNRQRERDIAAASGRFIPFSENDII